MKQIPILFNWLMVCILILYLEGCHENTWIQIDVPNGYPVFTISDENISSPLVIKGDTGAVYFKTVEGETELKGRPNEISNRDNAVEAKWILNEREIILSFEKIDGACYFSFRALPDSGITGWGMSLVASEDEYFTGLFERVVDGDQKESWKKGIAEAMNLRGQEVDMIIKPTLSLYTPFYLSSNGYGLFIEGTWPGHYDFCKSEPARVHISFEGPELSGIIYMAKHPVDIVKAHSLHTGPTIVPPKWAFLPWRWRDNHTHRDTYYDGTPVSEPYNSMVVEDILMMRALDIPCGVYWVDRPWAKGMYGYEDFEWDPERFPEAEKMIGWIHSCNIKFLLWIAPWVAGNMRIEANRRGYSQPMKAPHGAIDTGNVALLDFTNPEACTWWQQKGIEKMLEQGIDGFKLDRSEELVPETNELILFDGRTAREVRNEYPVLYARTVNEACRKVKGDDFVLIPRAGYSGSSKYSGFWGGDIGSPPEGLRTAIIAVQRCAILGFPIWGSDIGGYWQGNLDREICARWLAFGCFNPIMEFGPTEDRAPWDMANEPHYDTELIAIWRLYAKIHEALADYSHYLAKEAHETGMPIVRPLFLVAPDEKEAWSNWQTYMYGPDILVSAIWQKDISTYKVYLPKGSQWRDAWDSEKIYDGGQTVEIQTPLFKIPVFIRVSSTIDLGDLKALYKESYSMAENVPELKILEQQIY